MLNSSTWKTGVVLCIALAAMRGAAAEATAAPAQAGAPASEALRIMTFNLKNAAPATVNSWADRRPVMRECIRAAAPDIFGTQEGLYVQLKDLTADLPEYEWIGTGRDGGSRGEFMAIFFREERFEPLEFDHFWLSDTPDVVASTSWGNANRRMVTWVRFKDRRTSREFYVWNTHLDHQVQLAREKGAALIRQRVEALATPLPVILLGDFNAIAGANKAYDILLEGQFFADAWKTAAVRRGENIKTFHNYRGPVPGEGRIDWILVRGQVSVTAIEILTFNRNGQYPSDHFPVVADMILK